MTVRSYSHRTRYEVEYKVIVEKARKASAIESNRSTSFMGWTKNLSRSGLAIQIPKKAHFKKNDRIRITIQLGEGVAAREHLRFNAIVMWAGAEICGVKITDIDEQTSFYYEGLIDTCDVVTNYIPERVRKAV